jgi:hypothetical protein
MPEDVPLGTLLRRHRRAAGMTLEEAAETSGVSARAISDMERGRTRAPQRRTLRCPRSATSWASRPGSPCRPGTSSPRTTRRSRRTPNAQFASRMGATTVEIASGHVAMVSHPDAAADLIKKAASTVAS